VRKWAFTHPIPKNKLRKYQAEVNLDIIRALGVAADGHQTEIFLGPEDGKWAEGEFQKPEWTGQKWKIGLNPTGTWSSKRWPVDQWRRLAVLIHDRWGIMPVLLGGPGDEAILEEVKWGIVEKVLEKPATALLQAAAYISKLDLVIGNDGTPQHMAQAFGTRSITLCGPHWGMGWTKPNDVRHRFLQHFLDCGPCDKNVCPFPRQERPGRHVHQECLVKITPQRVLDLAGEMLGF
jgi:ADP-heptose:LPS heptosyltransferase